jgi:hypothetical protein
MINQVQNNFAVFAAGAGFGIFTWYLVKLAGPVLWQIAKKIGYKAWELMKNVASKLKFW